MIDIRLLRERPDEVREGYQRLGTPIDLDKVLAQDTRLRDLKNESQTLQAEQNRISKEIGRAAAGPDREQAKAASTQLKARIEGMAAELAAAEAALEAMMLELPNLPHPSVPVGKDDSENKVVREEGARRAFDFTPQPHWDLGTRLGIIDFERGVKISGSRFYVLKSWGARLQRALPKFGDNLYHDAEEDFWFIPTAEVPVTNMYRDEILDAATLPVRHVAFTACFRREQMAAGRDTRGIKRGHQFDKVELVKFVRPETSMDELDALLSDAEDVLKGLELPYRVVQMCTGDLSFSAMAKMDLELWAPGCAEWLEVSSCSNFGDFQARRTRIRFKEGKDKARFVHTLNGSGLALPRTMIGVLETYQRADGRIDVPAALRPYLGGATVLG